MGIVARPTRQTLALVYTAVLTVAALLRLSSAYVNEVNKLPFTAVTVSDPERHYLISRLNFTFVYPMFSGATVADTSKPGLREYGIEVEQGVAVLCCALCCALSYPFFYPLLN